jgi:hypothetical protein
LAAGFVPAPPEAWLYQVRIAQEIVDDYANDERSIIQHQDAAHRYHLPPGDFSNLPVAHALPDGLRDTALELIHQADTARRAVLDADAQLRLALDSMSQADSAPAAVQGARDLHAYACDEKVGAVSHGAVEEADDALQKMQAQDATVDDLVAAAEALANAATRSKDAIAALAMKATHIVRLVDPLEERPRVRGVWLAGTEQQQQFAQFFRDSRVLAVAAMRAACLAHSAATASATAAVELQQSTAQAPDG